VTDDLDEPLEQMRPSRSFRDSVRATTARRIADTASAIVRVVAEHPEGITPARIAESLGLTTRTHAFRAASETLHHSGRIRATGNVSTRRYYPAKKGS